MRTDETVIYVHIPRCGGTSLRNVFNCVYGATNVYDPFDQPDYRNFPKGSFDKYDVLYGHHHYGAHVQLTRPYKYITLLRDPVERAHSNWWYIQQHTTHRNYVEACAAKDAVAFFDMRADPWMDNGIVKMIAGVNSPDVPFGTVNNVLLQCAKENLHTCTVVGFLDELYEFFAMLRVRLDWQMIPFCPMKANASVGAPLLTPVLREQLTTRLELDIKLVDYARSVCKGQASYEPIAAEAQDLLLLHDTTLPYIEGMRSRVSRGCRNLTEWAKAAVQVYSESELANSATVERLRNYIDKFV